MNNTKGNLHIGLILPTVIILGLVALAYSIYRVGGDHVVVVNTSQGGNEGADTPTESGNAIEVVAENLSIPWDIAFLSDGGMLVTERDGALIFLTTTGERKEIKVPDVKHAGEGGLLGITLHPNFSSNRFVYLYITTPEADGTTNRVVRFVFDGEMLSDETTIIENIPGALYHDGGRMEFGPPMACASGKADCMLYITTGDATRENLAQDRNSLAGKILRIHGDGSIPNDNPFGNAVYSYGHRNPQGLAWDKYENLWSTEHGRSGVLSGLDELNLIYKGGNYGWPEIEGSEVRTGMENPIAHSGENYTWAPASLVYHDGRLFWGGLRGEALYVVLEETLGEHLFAGTRVEVKEHFKGEFGRIRTVRLGPDGMLYLTTSNTDGRGDVQEGDDKIIRLNPDSL